MFEKYTDLYYEMTQKKIDFIDESFYRVNIDDKTQRLKEKIEIVFYKRSVENFLLAPEKISIRKFTYLKNLRYSLMEEIEQKIKKEDVNSNNYDYMHIFCNDIDHYGLFFIKGKSQKTIVREIVNIILVGKTELKKEEK